ncbi:MAG: pectate lyase family protein [Planctomycetota bacterium]
MPLRTVRLAVAAAAAAILSAASVRADRPAFPDAVGFGVQTPGGRGGTVIRVTNLNAEGPGSLRAALAARGPRIVVFEVGGVIDLGRQSLRIAEPFVTVAGQTAPSPGITIIRGGIYIATHDVVVRHLRVRPGDAGRRKRSGWEPDGISTSGGDAHDIAIDHCSVTWAVDENISTSGPRTEGPDRTSRRVTISRCIIAECLHNATHHKGPHSKGTLIHDFCRDIAIIGNLYAHNVQRNPYFKAHTTGAIVNNVIYNPGSAAIQLGFSAREWRGARYKPVPPRVSVVGNVYIQGADTRQGLPMVARPGAVFLADNIALDSAGQPVKVVGKGVRVVEEKPVWPEGLEPLPAEKVLDHVARHVGARPRDRDAADRRIIRDLRRRKGRIIDSQDDVGGYPQVQPVRRKLDVPGENVEEWLARMAAEVQ